MENVICKWCGEKLVFVLGKGWVHSDGNLYKTRIMTAEEIERFKQRHNRYPLDFEKIVDDHCAFPVLK